MFEKEFEGKEDVRESLANLSQVTTAPGAHIYSLDRGKLFEVLNLLKSNKISYGTHFNTHLDIS